MARRAPIHSDEKASAILAADIHLSPRVPKCREEGEYISAIFKKLEFIRDLQVQHQCPVLCAGDVTDRWYLDKGEQWFVTQVIQLMHNWIAVAGQHDLPQHNPELYDKSWLAILEEARCIEVWENGFQKYYHDIELVISAFPWGEAPCAFKDIKSGHKSVALIHRMVYQGKPPYPGADKDGGTAKALMRKMKDFDLIVSGDNHETFVEELNGRLLVNPGSMMRTSAKQADHKPCVFLWYAGSNNIEQVVLPHDKHAVSREHLERKELHDSRMQAFVEKLKGNVDLSMGFKENVFARLKGKDISEETKAIVMEVLE